MGTAAFALISLVMLAFQTLPIETLSGTIDLQRNTLNGQVALGRGSVSLGARLTDAGPEGELSLGVPDLFSVAMSSANGMVQSTICGVVGPQEITVSGAQRQRCARGLPQCRRRRRRVCTSQMCADDGAAH